MQIVASVDIEDALRVDLSALYAAAGIEGVSFSATPIPPSLGDLPAAGTMVCIRRVGGSRSDLVEDIHAVSMDVYASTWGGAITEANRLVGMCLAMPYERGLSLHYHAAAITSQPVELPDTSNPVMPRVRCSMQFSVRGDVIMTS